MIIVYCNRCGIEVMMKRVPAADIGDKMAYQCTSSCNQFTFIKICASKSHRRIGQTTNANKGAVLPL